MLASLVILNNFVSDVYMEYIANMKCQLHHIHLVEYLIQQKHDQNVRHLCLHSCVSTSVYVYILGQVNSQHSMLANSDNNNHWK